MSVSWVLISTQPITAKAMEISVLSERSYSSMSHLGQG